ncbi:MAG TPA: hypothetical protein VK324_07060 [Tepidisphaeraceae bacterium]|nr:hypothetical protein [Tepidisphaeraceae bacterium]
MPGVGKNDQNYAAEVMVQHSRLAVLLVAAFSFVADRTYAHSDQIAPLAKVEKVYAAPEPIGRLSAVYTAHEGDAKESLVIECGLFKARVGAEGLTDLPRPDWGSFSVAYSLTSFEGKWVERPYLYVTVLLHGPPGQAWQQTWATFHFDADGKLTRRVKRFVPDEASKSIRVIWEDWPVGSWSSAEAILDAAVRN